jgi:cytochrome c biogenesis factor
MSRIGIKYVLQLDCLVLTEFSLLLLATCSPGIRHVTLRETKYNISGPHFVHCLTLLGCVFVCVCVCVRVRARARARSRYVRMQRNKTQMCTQSSSVITSRKELNTLCRYNRGL